MPTYLSAEGGAMRRREFIAVIGDVAVSMSVVLPLSALAHQGKVLTIGALLLGTPPPEAFLKGLREGLGDLAIPRAKT